ncbi:MAG TPA: M23 family metallopeptidase [Mycobacteriales bacterium]|nr:M23 family metallopeptidase [Mycobacteriales bacterium]
MPHARLAVVALVATAAVSAAGCSAGGHARAASATKTSTAPSSTSPAPLAAISTVLPGAAALSPAQTHDALALKQPHVSPLIHRINPDVFIQSSKPLTQQQIATIVKATGAKHSTLVATGHVMLGGGSTTAIGVNPSTFRSYAPKGTAESTPLWQSLARGDVAVAHTVARALAVPLGGETSMGIDKTKAWDFRVGAYATVGLPGVGVVVNQTYVPLLGLAPDSGLLITAPGEDPAVTAARAEEALGTDARDITATALRVAVGSDGRLTWVPPAIGPITQGFGVHNGRDPHGHPGIDIGAPFGAPIYAASAGTVIYAGPAEGFGNEVILLHAGGVQTVYGHMEKIIVAPGQAVRAGQPIALVGSEGESTGPHLHFEVHVNDQLVDPLVWLEQHGVKVLH